MILSEYYMTLTTTTEGLCTYRVSDDRARIVATPMGRLIRHLVRDSHFQGRAIGEWIARVDDSGRLTGYVRATLTERLETSFGIVPRRRTERAFTLAHAPLRKPRRKRRYVGAGRYRVTRPDGSTIRIVNLAQFCRDNDLPVEPMYSIVGGRQMAHQGWRVKRLA